MIIEAREDISLKVRLLALAVDASPKGMHDAYYIGLAKAFEAYVTGAQPDNPTYPEAVATVGEVSA